VDTDNNGVGFEPECWFVSFHVKSSRRWVNLLCIGRFKHVTAFGYVAAAKAWVVMDVLGSRMMVRVVRSDKDINVLAEMSAAGTVVRMPPVDRTRKNFRPKLVFHCVSFVAHTLGLSGSALRPDTLYRKCLRHGGEIISERSDDIRHKTRSQHSKTTSAG
jgi:hypothetical protein